MVITNIEDLMDILLASLTPEQIEEALGNASNRAEKKAKEEEARRKAREEARRKAEEEARKVALKKERITAARNDIINAYINYIKLISPKQLTDAEIEGFRKQFSNELQYFETAFIRF